MSCHQFIQTTTRRDMLRASIRRWKNEWSGGSRTNPQTPRRLAQEKSEEEKVVRLSPKQSRRRLLILRDDACLLSDKALAVGLS